MGSPRSWSGTRNEYGFTHSDRDQLRPTRPLLVHGALPGLGGLPVEPVSVGNFAVRLQAAPALGIPQLRDGLDAGPLLAVFPLERDRRRDHRRGLDGTLDPRLLR